jgi:serine/threonine kinase 16
VINYKLAEGGFSYIYCASDIPKPNATRFHRPRQYALKRIQCLDNDMVIKCEQEALVHSKVNSQYCLPLYTMQFMNDKKVCYMLFPLIQGGSLRDEVSRRRLLENHMYESIKPFKERQVLKLFRGIVSGVKALHDAGFAHCDVKLENILLDISNIKGDEEMGQGVGSSAIGTPVLMDFGSARELCIKLVDRRTVLNLVEEAAQNSTISYRSPELFEGGCRHGPLEADVDGKVDVWSLGCVLYAMMFGSSPFEIEYRKDDGSIRVVDCTQLRIINRNVSFPPKNSPRGNLFAYKYEMHELIDWMLTVDRTMRPSIDDVFSRLEGMNQTESKQLHNIV